MTKNRNINKKCDKKSFIPKKKLVQLDFLRQGTFCQKPKRASRFYITVCVHQMINSLIKDKVTFYNGRGWFDKNNNI